MKYTFYGTGSIWSPEQGRMLCSFGKQGVVQTEDPSTAEVLRAKGFQEGNIEGEAVEDSEVAEKPVEKKGKKG